MAAVPLDHHRAACGESRCGVPACDREGQWKIACREYGDRAERDLPLPQIRAGQRRAVRHGRVHPNAAPAAVTDDAGKEPQLVRGARQFTLGTALSNTGLGSHSFYDRLGDRLDFGRDALKKNRPGFGVAGAELGERVGSESRCPVDVFDSAKAVGGFEFFAGARVNAPKLSLGAAHLVGADKKNTCQFGGRGGCLSCVHILHHLPKNGCSFCRAASVSLTIPVTTLGVRVRGAKRALESAHNVNGTPAIDHPVSTSVLGHLCFSSTVYNIFQSIVGHISVQI